MGPVSLFLDLRIPHEHWGSSSNPSLNGHLHYPTDVDRTMKESTTDKGMEYLTDYNNRPSHVIVFIPTITSTSGRLHSEFVLLLFLQTDRETERFLGTSGVQVSQTSLHFESDRRGDRSSRFILKKTRILVQLQLHLTVIRSHLITHKSSESRSVDLTNNGK